MWFGNHFFHCRIPISTVIFSLKQVFLQWSQSISISYTHYYKCPIKVALNSIKSKNKGSKSVRKKSPKSQNSNIINVVKRKSKSAFDLSYLFFDVRNSTMTFKVDKGKRLNKNVQHKIDILITNFKWHKWM